jgi:hypothetical protein
VTDCRGHIASQFKFFFAFENALCNEYITEKFFRTLNFDIVPVVLGLGNYTKFIPKSGYINVLDFASVKDLADYLLYLDKHPMEYNKYFLWRQHISYNREKWSANVWPRGSQTSTFHSFCDMCIKLNLETFTGASKKSITNIKELFSVSNCKTLRFKENDEYRLVDVAMKDSNWACKY